MLNRIPNAMKFIHYEGLSGPKKVNYNNNNMSRRSRVAISVVSLPDNDNVIEYMRYINIFISI